MTSWKVLYIAFLNEESSYSTFQLLLYDFSLLSRLEIFRSE